MKKWLLVTTTDPEWIKMYQEDVINFEAQNRCNPGDLFLYAKNVPLILYLFLVKDYEPIYPLFN